jgi:O-antigen ligase
MIASIHSISGGFKAWVIRFVALPAKRKIYIISLLMIFVSFYSAPFGVLLLAGSLLYELRKTDSVSFFRWNIIKHSTFFIPGIILIASGVIGPIWYGHYNSAGLGFLILAPIVLAVSLIEILWSPEDVLHFVRYATILLIPVCIFAFLFPWSGSFIAPSEVSLRLMGTFANPNYFAYFLEIILLFNLALLYHVWEKASRNGLIVSGLFGILCLYLTDSRSGMLAFLVGLTVFFLCMSEKTALTIIFGLMSILLIVTAIFPEMSVSLFKDMIPRHEHFLSEFNHRFMLWEIALKEIYREPFLGTGIGTYKLFIPENVPSAIADSIHAHNIYVNFMLELGLWGIISFMWMIYRIVRKLLSALQRSGLRPFFSAGIGMISVTLIHGLMDAPLVSSQAIAFFSLLLGTLSISIKNTIGKK